MLTSASSKLSVHRRELSEAQPAFLPHHPPRGELRYAQRAAYLGRGQPSPTHLLCQQQMAHLPREHRDDEGRRGARVQCPQNLSHGGRGATLDYRVHRLKDVRVPRVNHHPPHVVTGYGLAPAVHGQLFQLARDYPQVAPHRVGELRRSVRRDRHPLRRGAVQYPPAQAVAPRRAEATQRGVLAHLDEERVGLG